MLNLHCYTWAILCWGTWASHCDGFSCCCSVAQLCPTLCDPMDCSRPGFPVLHHLLELAQTLVHWVGDAIKPSHPLSSPSTVLQSFPASRSFLMSWLFASGGQSTGASVSALVLPVNIQGWFPFSSVQFSCSVVSDSLWPHESQHTRLPCPSLSPRDCSNSCPLSCWCHPTISSSADPFSSCPQSFPV